MMDPQNSKLENESKHDLNKENRLDPKQIVNIEKLGVIVSDDSQIG